MAVKYDGAGVLRYLRYRDVHVDNDHAVSYINEQLLAFSHRHDFLCTDRDILTF